MVILHAHDDVVVDIMHDEGARDGLSAISRELAELCALGNCGDIGPLQDARGFFVTCGKQ
jgi:hypothetical protein